MSKALNKYDYGSGDEILISQEDLLSIPSRVLAMNHIFGGGIPYGRIVEIAGDFSSGKTLLAMDFMRSTVKLGGAAVFIDAENSMTAGWLEKNGIDPTDIDVFPEVEIETIGDFIRDWAVDKRSELTENEPILVVIDSVAAMDSAAKFDENQQDSKAEMGSRAKATYKMIRMLNPLLSKLGISLILINQIRMKLGVMFGDNCLHSDTRITLKDRRSIPIGQLVRDKVKGEVLSINDNGDFQWSKITGWFENGKIEDSKQEWVQILTDAVETKNGRYGITCTNDHLLLTPSGYTEADKLQVGDKLVSTRALIINGTLMDFMAGTLVGDTSIRVKGKNGSIKIVDQENWDYAFWKQSKIEGLVPGKEGWDVWHSDFSRELYKLSLEVGNRDPLFLLDKHYSDLGLALWFMDDGHSVLDRKNPSCTISIYRIKDPTHVARIIEALKRIFIAQDISLGTQGRIRFNILSCKELFERIYKYVPDCMSYKLPTNLRGKYEDFTISNNPQRVAEEVTILELKKGSNRKYRKPFKFDIEVEGTHNYLVGGSGNGVVSHNSTTPGGKAIEYFATIRVATYKGKKIEIRSGGKKVKIGNYVSLRTWKNKIAPPVNPLKDIPLIFRETEEHDIGFGKYVGLVDILIEEGVLEKSGNTYSFDGERIAIGKDNVLAEIESDAELRKDILEEAEINTIGRTRERIESLTDNLYPLGKYDKFL